MRRFTGFWGNRLQLAFKVAISFGVVCIGLFPGHPMDDASGWIGRCLIFLMGGGLGGYMLYGLAESFTVYVVDDQGISRRAWNGRHTMLWRDLQNFEGAGQNNGAITLIDHQQRRIPLYLSLFTNAKSGELRTLLDPYLAPIRERRLRDLYFLEKEYRVSEFTAWVMGFGVVLCSGLLVLVMLLPDTGEEIWLKVGGGLFVGSMDALLLYAAIKTFTKTLRVTKGEVTERCAFYTHSILLHHVESLTCQETQNQAGKFEVLEIVGDGHKIRLHSHMRDYDLLKWFIQGQVDIVAQMRGDEAIAPGKRKERQV